MFSLHDIVGRAARAGRRPDDERPFINMVVGANAFQGALPYTPKLLQTMVDHLPRGYCVFNVSAIGVGAAFTAMNSPALAGHVRGRPEHNLYYEQGVLSYQRATGRTPRAPSARDGYWLYYRPTEAREIIGLRPLR